MSCASGTSSSMREASRATTNPARPRRARPPLAQDRLHARAPDLGIRRLRLAREPGSLGRGSASLSEVTLRDADSEERKMLRHLGEHPAIATLAAEQGPTARV